MTSILIFLTAIGLGLVTAGVAKWKGRRPMTWLLYGVVGSPVAIPLLLMLERRPSEHTHTPIVYFSAAIVVFALVAVVAIHRLQNTPPI